ncbi:hypothetical protein HanHA300_Chr13g0465961 [Helianthus annuus]|nr:hypothetical protein HanHA300_Chr13g0465961 [Helianthus annuus]KAJ0496305.1 hypothetical protein HanHA89_Chr13g0498141 [Helianthus annuus]KAJ0662365.1 hypothetical protein HanLR1_Chr13g0468581 [Helianthus annuus]
MFNSSLLELCLSRVVKVSDLNHRLYFRTQPIWSFFRIRPNTLGDHSCIGNNLLRLYLMVASFK